MKNHPELPENKNLQRLLEEASGMMTSAERQRQRRGFAYGNVKTDNPNITRADIDKADSLELGEAEFPTPTLMQRLFLPLFFLVMFALKLTGPMASVSWWWVTAPLWAPMALVLVAVIGCVSVALLFRKNW